MKTVKTSLPTSSCILYLKSTLLGILFGSMAIVLMLLVFTGILLISGTLPHDILVWLDIAACGVGCYIAGYTSSRITKHNALISGMLSGTSIFIILLSSGFICGETLSYISLVKLLVIILTSVIGAIKGINKKEKLHIK